MNNVNKSESIDNLLVAIAWEADALRMRNDIVKKMVDRFLGWKLPADFAPDCGISFTREFNAEYMASQGKPPMINEPIGTNLLNADQAKAMILHMLCDDA